MPTFIDMPNLAPSDNRSGESFGVADGARAVDLVVAARIGDQVEDRHRAGTGSRARRTRRRSSTLLISTSHSLLTGTAAGRTGRSHCPDPPGATAGLISTAKKSRVYGESHNPPGPPVPITRAPRSRAVGVRLVERERDPVGVDVHLHAPHRARRHQRVGETLRADPRLRDDERAVRVDTDTRTRSGDAGNRSAPRAGRAGDRRPVGRRRRADPGSGGPTRRRE